MNRERYLIYIERMVERQIYTMSRRLHSKMQVVGMYEWDFKRLDYLDKLGLVTLRREQDKL